jgi:hypothetical protein
MSLSIDELDATVRAFYEGRGETVCVLVLWLYRKITLWLTVVST